MSRLRGPDVGAQGHHVMPSLVLQRLLAAVWLATFATTTSSSNVGAQAQGLCSATAAPCLTTRELNGDLGRCCQRTATHAYGDGESSGQVELEAVLVPDVSAAFQLLQVSTRLQLVPRLEPREPVLAQLAASESWAPVPGLQRNLTARAVMGLGFAVTLAAAACCAYQLQCGETQRGASSGGLLEGPREENPSKPAGYVRKVECVASSSGLATPTASGQIEGQQYPGCSGFTPQRLSTVTGISSTATATPSPSRESLGPGPAATS